MAWSYTHRRRVVFSETDLAGIMHFSNFFRWMEETEHAFYRSLGLSVHPLHNGVSETRVGWPRVRATCDYRAPLKFEEELDVELLVSELRSKSISYQFIFRKLDADRTIAAVGGMVVVSVSADPATQKMHAIAIPESFGSQIEVAPAESLIIPHPIR